MNNENGPFTLAEVARITGLSERFIKDGCRAGRIEHTPRGAGTKRVHRVMYRHQIDKLIEQQTVAAGESSTQQPDPVDEMAAARAMTRERLKRRTGHRRAA